MARLLLGQLAVAGLPVAAGNPELIVFSADVFHQVDALRRHLLLIVMPLYGLTPGPAILLVPVFLALAVITALGVGIWLAALTARYRDFRYLVPFLERFWFFASPVAYASMEITQPWRTLYGLNPMIGVVEGFRWGVLRERPPSGMIVLSITVAVMTLLSGIYYFRRVERTFADLI